MASYTLALLFYILSLYNVVHCQTYPAGCSYDDTDASVGVYKCDFSAVSKPIPYSGFSSPYPQRLKIYNVQGNIASAALFSGFSSFTSANFDSNYAASLEIECVSSTNTAFLAGAFTDMGYLQGVTIKNCQLTAIDANVFSEIGNVDYFRIEGGSIASLVSTSFSGLNVSKLSVPNPSGEFAIKNCATPGTFPANIFDHLTFTKTFNFDNAGVTEIGTSTFSLNTAMTYLVLSNNGITSLTNNVFNGLDGLSTVDMTGLSWTCTCDKLWFLKDFETDGIEIIGGPVCSTGERSTSYYSANCPGPDACGDTPGIAMGSSCMTVYQLVSYGVLLVTLVLSCVALGLVCQTRKQLTDNKSKLKNKKNSSWNKVQDALKRGGNTGQKPPANTAAPKGKGWV